ncbi:glycosyltransferase family 9 protein [bacterium]|nr:glycosyltransferase family 9 protein [bacterium]
MNIAIIRLSSLGDIVLTAPAIRGLRNAFPAAKLTFVTSTPYAELAACLPEIDDVFSFRLQKNEFVEDCKTFAEQKWDKVADLHGSQRSAIIRKHLRDTDTLVDRPPRLRRALLIGVRVRLGEFRPVPLRYLDQLTPWSVQDDGKGLELRIPENVFAEVDRLWKVTYERPYAIIPGAKHRTKQWHEERWLELANRLSEFAPVVVIGSGRDISDDLKAEFDQMDRVYNLCGTTRIPEAAAILSRCRAVISGDTGPMHLAVSQRVPLVAIFGPTVREFGFYPFRTDNSVVLENKMWCRPCTAHGSDLCPIGHHNCMNFTTVDRVFDSVMKVEFENNDQQDTI